MNRLPDPATVSKMKDWNRAAAAGLTKETMGEGMSSDVQLHIRDPEKYRQQKAMESAREPGRHGSAVNYRW